MGHLSVIELRATFIAQVFTEVPHLATMRGTTMVIFLRALVNERQTIVLLAKYAYEVLEIFYEVPILWPATV
jgi:hypothetical protein